MQPIDLLARMEAAKTDLKKRYPSFWHRMVMEWTRPETSDRAWLMYSANYLFRTGGVRWALDPITLRHRLPVASRVDLDPLVMLDYVVLSHRHADHIDLNLLTRLCDFPAQWIVPEFLYDLVRTIESPRRRAIFAKPMETLELGGLRLTPFEGNHWETSPGYPGDQRGVPSMGYLAEFNGKRWLFPGDTRSYNANQLPSFGVVDGLFAHLWLGRGCALHSEPPLSDAFCQFCLGLSSNRILLTHLREFGRDANDYWDGHHAQKIMHRLQAADPRVQVAIALMGNRVTL